MIRLIVRSERPGGLLLAWPALSCNNWDCMRKFWVGRFWPGGENGFHFCSLRCLESTIPPSETHRKQKLDEFLETLRRAQEASRKSRQMIAATQRAHLATSKSKLRFP